MNAPTPQETVTRLRRPFRRWAVLGVVLVLAGVGVAVSPSLWAGRARTEGTVIKVELQIELVQHGNPHAGEMVFFEEVVVAYPVVEYQVGDREYTLRSSSSLTVGQKVPVLYKADRPGVATIDTFADRWAGPLALGGVQLVLGVVIMVGAAHANRMFRQLEATLTGGSEGVEGDKGPGQAAPSPAGPGAAPDRGGR